MSFGFMPSRAIFVAVLMAFVTSANSALAHSPYFSKAEKITLPSGKSGELRLVHGDGIFWVDPIRVLALDEEGRMIARSPPSPSMALSCLNTRCRVFDPAEGAVLELDPSTFRIGAVVPAIDNADHDLNWEFYGNDNESWGWRWRKADFLESIWGNLALAHRIGMSIGFTIIAGAIAGPVLRAAFKRKPTVDRPILIMSMARLIRRLMLIMTSSALVFTSFLLAIIGSGATLALWTASLIGGAAVTMTISAVLRGMEEDEQPPSAITR
ncbi:hypothetical protein IYX23_06815 [Methylocystis sp. L43]|jgi:hypothetical protein|uniref:hypothetical protein n=1 Tax=unclassified Methylocystis TaxID=2625913 RepID=UPI0018C2E11A|nr:MULTISPECIES: hypothetical protein [unclassified Methylocystis]MBG0797384.1 hypothetical protein [Methylocystis sp. L43]MBG0807763.1 hypothetical protein [Methylocystis sp. H15]